MNLDKIKADWGKMFEDDCYISEIADDYVVVDGKFNPKIFVELIDKAAQSTRERDIEVVEQAADRPDHLPKSPRHQLLDRLDQVEELKNTKGLSDSHYYLLALIDKYRSALEKIANGGVIGPVAGFYKLMAKQALAEGGEQEDMGSCRCILCNGECFGCNYCHLRDKDKPTPSQGGHQPCPLCTERRCPKCDSCHTYYTGDGNDKEHKRCCESCSNYWWVKGQPEEPTPKQPAKVCVRCSKVKNDPMPGCKSPFHEQPAGLWERWHRRFEELAKPYMEEWLKAELAKELETLRIKEPWQTVEVKEVHRRLDAVKGRLGL